MSVLTASSTAVRTTSRRAGGGGLHRSTVMGRTGALALALVAAVICAFPLLIIVITAFSPPR